MIRSAIIIIIFLNIVSKTNEARLSYLLDKKREKNLTINDDFFNATMIRTYDTFKIITKSKTINLINLPDVRQATDYTCGPSALQSVLMFYGEEVREDKLADKTDADPDKGTLV